MAVCDRFGRGEQRRQQVLDAAAQCFRRSGFRGASMAEISEAAGMSTGHIYHYFKSKEAIVEAIVERQQERGLDIIHGVAGADDILAALVESAGPALDTVTRVNDPVLAMEIHAEAARNPVVSAIVKECDRKIGGSLRELLQAGQSQGRIQSEVDADALATMLDAVFVGLIARAAVTPDFDGSKVLPALRLLLTRYLDPSR